MDKLIIDGIEVEPNPERTVLEVAQEAGIEIPTLCSHKSLMPSGACRLCLVETIWKGRSNLKTACTYPAWEGEVRTNSELVKRARRFILQLMLSEAPDSEEVRELAVKHGVLDTQYSIRTDTWNNKCVLCGLCVRTCDQIMNIHAIEFAGRGTERYITTPLKEYSDICSTCGACEFMCPTGAIKVSDWTDKPVKPIPADFDRGLVSRPVVSIPFPQAVPNIPAIDSENCMHFKTDACGVCADVCGPEAIDFNQEERIIETDVGAIVVATGFDLYPIEEIGEYGYGKIPNVIDTLAFERLLAASGPTAGKVQRPSDGKVPKKIVFVQCVRSRDPEHGMAYCSRVCCMYTSKVAMLYKHAIHDGEAYIFYIDIRSNGRMYEEFVQRAREEEGVKYIRGKVAKVIDNGDTVQVWGADTLTGRQIKIDADMVVLSPPMIPAKGAIELANRLRIPTDEYGWIKEAHLKLRPLESLTAGIFLAGVCQYPKDITDTASQASGAASKVQALFSQPQLTREPLISAVDKDICAGCGTCEEVCAYGAIEVDQNLSHAVVNDALCEGCGSCAAACPSGAVEHVNFRAKQLMDMVIAATE